MPPTVEPVSATAFSRGAVAHVFCSHAAAVGVGYPREHERARLSRGAGPASDARLGSAFALAWVIMAIALLSRQCGADG